MSEMKCKRCGTDESRIDGFCSIECRDAFDYEEEIAELQDANTELHSRIAELEAESERFTAHGDIERQDDKSPNDTQTDTVVYGKEDSEVQ